MKGKYVIYNKKSYLFFCIIFLTIFYISGCSKKSNDDIEKVEEPSTSINEELVKDQEVENFKLTNTSLIYENNSSILITEVKNISSETQYIKSFDIIVKDESNNIITTMLGYIGEEIKSGETRKITSSSDLYLLNKGSIEYKINR